MNSSDDIVITVKNLTMGYEGKVLLQDLSFQVRRGEVLVILGASGSGKSTLLKHMIGLYPPMSGDVLFGADSIIAAEGEDRLRLLRKFGVMYQSGALFGSLTVLENVRLPLDEFTELPMEARELIAMAKLELVDMEAAAGKLPAELSGGMQKRAAIARAMALDPGILFLDEPSSGLDPITSAGVDSLINDLSGNLGITFVVVTHDLESIYCIADRVLMLDPHTKGIVAEGSPEELRDHSPTPWVRQFFHREPEPAREPMPS